MGGWREPGRCGRWHTIAEVEEALALALAGGIGSRGDAGKGVIVVVGDFEGHYEGENARVG